MRTSENETGPRCRTEVRMERMLVVFVSSMLVAAAVFAQGGIFVDGFEIGGAYQWSEVVTPICGEPTNMNDVNCTVDTDIDHWVEPFEFDTVALGAFSHDPTQGHASAGCMAGVLEAIYPGVDMSGLTRSLCLHGVGASKRYQQGYFAKMKWGSSHAAKCAIWAYTYMDSACSVPTSRYPIQTSTAFWIDSLRWYDIYQIFTTPPLTNSMSFHVECVMEEDVSDTVLFDDLYVLFVP